MNFLNSLGLSKPYNMFKSSSHVTNRFPKAPKLSNFPIIPSRISSISSLIGISLSKSLETSNLLKIILLQNDQLDELIKGQATMLNLVKTLVTNEKIAEIIEMGTIKIKNEVQESSTEIKNDKDDAEIECEKDRKDSVKDLNTHDRQDFVPPPLENSPGPPSDELDAFLSKTFNVLPQKRSTSNYSAVSELSFVKSNPSVVSPPLPSQSQDNSTSMISKIPLSNQRNSNSQPNGKRELSRSRSNKKGKPMPMKRKWVIHNYSERRTVRKEINV